MRSYGLPHKFSTEPLASVTSKAIYAAAHSGGATEPLQHRSGRVTKMVLQVINVWLQNQGDSSYVISRSCHLIRTRPVNANEDRQKLCVI